MSIEVANMAKKYYPKLWGIERLDALRAADKLTQEEYDALVAIVLDRLGGLVNKQPAKYLQTDKRWKSLPYRVKGEDATIGGSGCGPSCAAMLITTLTGKTVTPVDTCKWSVKHGYKALNQGTYYSYFVPQFAEYGIACKQLLASRIINQPKHPIHDQVREYLKQGYYVIALMGPGTWTRSGHFVVLWDWDDKVRINDPASTKSERLNGDPNTFRNEARCYWLVDARNYNKDLIMETFDISVLFMIIAAVTALTNIIVQVLKKSLWDKLPTNLLALIVAVALTLAAFFAYTAIKSIVVEWYMIVAAVVVGFLAAYAAMFGFDKLKEALGIINSKK